MQRAKKRGVRKNKGRQMRIYKNPNSTIFNSNVEFNSNIRLANAANIVSFTSSGFKYLDIATILTTSTAFTEMSARFSMYRINGMKLELRSLFSPPTNGINEHLFLAAGFFPSVTSAHAGASATLFYDKSLIASTNQVLMSRKQTFYNNYFEGTGAGGYGTWNSSSTVSALSGSISIESNPASSNATAHTLVAVLRIILNVTFKEKQLT